MYHFLQLTEIAIAYTEFMKNGKVIRLDYQNQIIKMENKIMNDD